MSLLCEERCPPETEERRTDDLDLDGGVRSIEDPNLLRDRRVLGNVLEAPVRGGGVVDYFARGLQPELKPHMRKIVADWMLEVCEEQGCQPEVFGLAVDYLDRTLARLPVSKGQFQLLACVCIFLASKFKETSPLCADKLVVYTDFSITTQEITQWELVVLQALHWDLSSVTSFCILDQLLCRLDLSSVGFSPSQIRSHAETFAALAATEHSLNWPSAPGLTAVACLLAACNGMQCNPTQAKEVRRMLTELSALAGVSEDAVVTFMEGIEAAVRERTPSPPTVPTQPQPEAAAKQPSANPSAATFCEKNNPSSPPSPSASPTDLMDIACVY